jgi:hypothetical protein
MTSIARHSGARAQPASPESITTIDEVFARPWLIDMMVVLDSGFAPSARPGMTEW